MTRALRLVLVVHDHQPIGNFESVVEQAYQDSYLPFLKLFARYPSLRISLHLGGSLFDWLEGRHPEYLNLVSELVRAGRIQILGGAYYEPILPMIPRRDRRGQIRQYSDRLAAKFGRAPLGMWLPERVWEQSLTSDLAESGIEHTVLDDFHFKNAGLADDELFGYYLTEDEGRLLAVFPGNERLRYSIPFAPPQETIDYLRGVASTHPDAVVVFGDDGEKFGTWPGMHEHCYEQGWLEQFFDLLAANADWLTSTTLAETVNNVAPRGKIYLPDASYREMSRWASLADRYSPTGPGAEIAHIRSERGSWRNFRVKYPEADEMYSRMLAVSNRVASAQRQAGETEPEASEHAELVESARDELYRAQCNCAYWHGTFGGVYLPHLRQAVYRHLIGAETLLDRAKHGSASWVEAGFRDFNLDIHKEVLLTNDELSAYVSPERGGHLYELDLRDIRHNLLATLARRPEPYHTRLAADGQHAESRWAPEDYRGLDLKQAAVLDTAHAWPPSYDSYPRKSLVDHFYPNDAQAADAAGRGIRELGDFVCGRYEAVLRRKSEGVELEMVRLGLASGYPIKITKLLKLAPGSKQLEVEYRLEGLPAKRPLHFAVELNFAGIAVNAPNRYLTDGKKHRVDLLDGVHDLGERKLLHLVDEQLGLDVGLRASRATGFWTFPVHSINRCEAGLELVQQSFVMMPHWHIVADARGTWSVTLRMALDTALAQSRATLSSDDELGAAARLRLPSQPRGRMSVAA